MSKLTEQQTAIYLALGEASALFMSQPIKGTEIIMPVAALADIAKRLDAEIMEINSGQGGK